MLFFAVFGVLSVACGEQELERAFLKLETTNLEFEAVGAAVQTVAVTSNVDWDCTMSDESRAWISVEKRTGGVAVAVADNSGVESRSGAVTLVPASPRPRTETDNGRSVRQQLYTVGGTRLAVLCRRGCAGAGDCRDGRRGNARVDGRRGRGMPELGDGGPERGNGRRDGGRQSGNRTALGECRHLCGCRGVGPKAVKVVQEGRVLQPSLGVDVRELQFGSRAEMLGQTVNVAAVAVDWKVVTSDTPDTSGNPVEWISIVSERDSYFIVNVETNATLEERSGYVVVTSGQDDVPDIAVAVTQEAGREFLSDLTGDAVMEDLPGGGRQSERHTRR